MGWKSLFVSYAVSVQAMPAKPEMTDISPLVANIKDASESGPEFE